MSKHLVLSVKSYDFRNNDGEQITGAKVSYINKKPSSREAELGHPPMIVSINDMKLVQEFREVPGIYEMEFEQITGKNNKPEISLFDVDFIETFDVSVLF